MATFEISYKFSTEFLLWKSFSELQLSCFEKVSNCCQEKKMDKNWKGQNISEFKSILDFCNSQLYLEILNKNLTKLDHI